MGNYYAILDHGCVELIAHAGSDLSVVNSARVSYGRESTEVGEAEVKLIGYLMRHRHGTPFEHNMFTFRIKAPIFIFREWQRHRIGSFNEMSARYMELPEEWYVPFYKNVRTRVGKPGHYTYEQVDKETASNFVGALDDLCAESYEAYTNALGAGIAPEQARMFLHVNHYSQMYWTVNARSLMNFLSLRNAPTAQWEIQQYADIVEHCFADAMPVTHQAFVDNNRTAP